MSEYLSVKALITETLEYILRSDGETTKNKLRAAELLALVWGFIDSDLEDCN